MKDKMKKTSYKGKRALLATLAVCTAVSASLAFTTHLKKNEQVDKKQQPETPIAIETPVEQAMTLVDPEQITQAEYEALVQKEREESGGMVKFGHYRQRFKVNKTTLYIGTYLIEFSALNETYYRLANLSKSQRNQPIEYYKSEIQTISKKNLSGYTEDDVWVELKDANLETLTTGIKTKEQRLDDYWISCVIDDEGAHDPVTGDLIDLFDESLYDLLSLPELKPLKEKYDAIEEKPGRTDNEAKHNYYTRNLLVALDGDANPADTTVFLKYKDHGRNEITNRCDVEIKALKAYHSKFENDASEITEEKASVILDLYAREDAKRRVEIYKFLSQGEGDTEAALVQIENMLRAKAQEEGSGFEMDTEYVEAVEKSLENCKDSYESYLGMVLAKGTTVIANTRFNWSNKMFDYAFENTLEQNGEGMLSQLLALNHIGAGEIKDKEMELLVLTAYLLPVGVTRYENKVLTEVCTEYTAALREGKSEDEKKEIIMAQYNDAVKQMQELEFLVKSTTDRQEKEEAVKLIQEQIELATLWKYLTFDDPYGPLAKYCIDLYIEWLKNLYRDITDEDYDLDLEDSTPTDADFDPYDPDEDPEKKRKIDALTGGGGENLATPTDPGEPGDGDPGPGPFMDGVNNMGPDDLLKDLGDRVKDDLNKGNYGILDSLLRAAGDLGFDPNDLIPKDLYDGKDGRGGRGGSEGDETIDPNGRGKNGSGNPEDDGKNRKNRRDNENYGRNYGDGDDNKDGNGKPWGDASDYGNDLKNNGQGNEADLTDKQIEDLIKSLFGASFDDLDPDLQAAVVVALNRYGKMHNAQNVLAYARKLLGKIMQNGNPLVYAQYEADQTTEYVSLGAMDHARDYTDFRLVLIEGMDTASQISGTASYSFKGNRVTKSDDETEDMANALGYQIDDYVSPGGNYPYISETDAMKYLVENGEYIVDTTWAVLVTAKMEVEVSKIISELEKMAGLK